MTFIMNSVGYIMRRGERSKTWDAIENNNCKRLQNIKEERMRKRFAILMTVILFMTPLQFIPMPQQVHAAPEEDAANDKLHYYILPRNFSSFGSWTLSGDFLQGRATGSTIEEADGSGGEPATVNVNIQSTGEYKLWVRDRDYATNQPGTRTFHVGVDGVRVEQKFGIHGQEGFRWTAVGTFQLNAGFHELSLIDTSGFYARSEGFFLTKDLSLVPPENKEELEQIAPPEDPFATLPSAEFPEWATADVTAVKTASIENEQVKVTFYQGEGADEQSLVQNEIYIKENNEWLLVKTKTEQLGFLMMSATNSELAGEDGQFAQFRQTVDLDGNTVSTVVKDFFKTGIPVWFIPSDFTQVNDERIDLSFTNTEADLQVSFELDALTVDPKVTLNADFHTEGAYSFMLFNGDETEYEAYDTVTAPLLYVKKTVPAAPSIIPESYLFTPMATLHYAENNLRFQGVEMTSGIAMDPGSVGQDFAYPDTSSFALVLRGPDGDVRPQFTAPMFGTEHSLFEAGSSYSVAYRIINNTGSWYDTFKYVAEELYAAKDIRTNYFHSLNEAIYNATDLMMDDDYGGWDPVNMAHYNMEEKEMTTLSNGMTAVQRYLLTDNEELLDERAVPTLAFMLSRMNTHFKITDSKGGASYSGVLPTPIGGPVKQYSASVFGGLYEMTQGRMPFLLDHAIDSASQQPNLAGVTDQAAMYKYTGDAQHLVKLKEQADRYLADHPNTGANREARFVNGFVYGDYIPMVTTLLAAYEATGEQKYLDGAEENAQLLVTGLWTTGYQNDYADTGYTVTDEKTAPRKLNAEKFTFWWHGEQQWRLGNVDGEAKPPQESGPKLETETHPGWLPARVGMGTEHPSTPGHGNVITMNNWAGMLTKLSVYTGDPYFSTMARNAMIGRFGNYAGYYQDRYIFHQMKENYPYTGPDFTSVYWHHIPVFISMLEDFLINSAWAKSEQNISFPSLYQSGYAYFASNQFGHAPGQFYEEEDMWLWLDRGIAEPDSVEIDYIAARKDGVLGLALMNEGNDALTSTITLGDKVDPGASYSGTAVVYEADGTASQVQVTNGAFTITIPAKGIRSVVLNIPNVQAPGYANTDYEYSNYTEDTVSEHTRGKGHVIQLHPDSYYAYIYVSDMDETTSKLTMNYTAGGEETTVEKSGFPYEFLIKVDDPEAVFEYELTATGTDNETESLGGGTLQIYDFTHPGVVTEEPGNQGPTVPFPTWVLQSGMNVANNTIRLVVPVEDFLPLTVKDDSLKGMRVAALLQHKTDGSALNLNSVIVGNEVITNGTMALAVTPTAGVPLAAYQDYEITLQVAVPKQLLDNKPSPITVTQVGMAAERNEIRLVVPQADFPFPVAANGLSGLRISGTLTSKLDQSVLNLDSVIRSNEVRPAGTTVLVVEPTTAVPLRDYKDYNFHLAVDLPSVEEPRSSFDLTVDYPGMHAGRQVIRLVVDLEDIPFELQENELFNWGITGTLQHKTNGMELQLDSIVTANEVRTASGTAVLEVRPTEAVPLMDYKDYNIAISLHPPGFEPFDLAVSGAGMNPDEKVLRLVVEQADIPFLLKEGWLDQFRVSGELKKQSDGSMLRLDSMIRSTELRNDGTVELVIPATSRVPLAEYSDYDIELTLYPQKVGVWNRDAASQGHFRYIVDTDENEVSITGYTGRGSAVIPETIEGLPVTEIGDSAFQNKGLTSVVLPGSVTLIGDSAFRDNQLTAVTLPDSVERIGNSAFRLNQLAGIRVEGLDLLFGGDLFKSNPEGLIITGYAGSSAETYAGDNDYEFIALTPLLELSGLSIDGVAIDGFAPGRYEYALQVGSGVAGVTVTPTVAAGSAAALAVRVNDGPDTAVVSGEASPSMSLKFGANKLEIVLTDEEVETEQVYTVNIARAAPQGNSSSYVPSNNARLSSLSLSEGALRPSFSADVMSYEADVTHKTESVTVTATAEQSGAVIRINGAVVTSGQASSAIALSVGGNRMEAEVTAADGSRHTYIVTVTRQAETGGEEEAGSEVEPEQEAGGESGEPEERAAFTDMAGHWAERHVARLAGLGITTGYPDGRFQPDGAITRAEFTAIVVRAFGLEAAEDSVFEDTAGHWARAEIAAAYAAGWISGYNDEQFGPDERITREQMAVIVMRALQAADVDADAANPGGLSFKDGGEIADWAQAAAAQSAEVGIITGYEDGSFRPQHPATRAEAVVVIGRAMDVRDGR
ncbi:hypothetical protein EBB07_21035 [Paenibacillaceae bacterium]|nr:hypothetical protein EBB07_21035 [Paenibacillaceae bacterium]